MVSLAVSAALTAFENQINAAVPFGGVVLSVLNVLVSLALISFLFVAVFKVLPDCDLEWRDVAVGAIITAGLPVGPSTSGDDNRIPASTCLVRTASKACSKSSATRTSIISASSASARAAGSVAVNCAALRSGMPTIAMRESRETIYLSSWASKEWAIARDIAASGVFGEMQAALYKVWKAEPRGTTVGRLIRARAKSLGLVAALGFL